MSRCENESVFKEWICSKCKLINVNINFKCVSCGSFEKHAIAVTFWICAQCTRRNTHLNKHCEFCFSSNSKEQYCYCLRCTTQKKDVRNCDTCRYRNEKENRSLINKSVILGSPGRTPYPYRIKHKEPYIDSIKKNICQKTISFKSDSNFLVNNLNVSVHSMTLENIWNEQKEKALKSWHEIVRKCKRQNKPFMDAEFPPNLESVHGYDSVISKDKSLKIQWLRPNKIKNHDYCTLPWTVFRNPVPSDIIQGYLGDCWFISALSVIAEHEHLIKNIVVTQEYCSQGVYQIRLCKDGQWETVLVDDLLPCDEYGRILYSRAKKNQLWVSLIEKAAAKLYGCYKYLDGGFPAQGLALLTGQPCDSLALQESSFGMKMDYNVLIDADIIWAKLLSSKEMNFLISTSSGHTYDVIRKNKFDLVGLEYDHAYSVLDVSLVNCHRLLKLYNPHGSSSWNGNWSKMSTSWTPELKQLLQPDKVPAGVFWISFEDVLKYFTHLDICKIRKRWKEVRLECKPLLPFAENGNCLLLNVFEATEIEFSLFEKKKTTGQNHHGIHDIGVAIFSVVNNTNFIGTLVACSQISQYVFTGLQCMLKCGQYFVICFGLDVTWRMYTTAVPHCLLAINSSRHILLEQIPSPSGLLTDVVIGLVMAQGKKKSRPQLNFYFLEDTIIYVLVAENLNTTDSCEITCNLKENNGKSIRKKNRTVDIIPPRHRQILLLTETKKNTGIPYELQIKTVRQEKLFHLEQCVSDSQVNASLVSNLHIPRKII